MAETKIDKEIAPKKIWKYMDLPKFVSLLSSEAIFFASVGELSDPYEGFYPKSYVRAFSEVLQKAFDQVTATRDQITARAPGIDLKPLEDLQNTIFERLSGQEMIERTAMKFGISCWHQNDVESEAMWKLYAQSGQGIAIESTASQLAESIQGREDLIVSSVRYMDFENEPIDKAAKHHGLFMKRKSFEHEREVRATIMLKEFGHGELVRCNLEQLVNAVHVSPFAPTYFRDVIANLCAGNLRKLNRPVQVSKLLEKPGYGIELRHTAQQQD